MKKSELCRVAQLTVLKDAYLKNEDKLAIIQYLHDREDTELTLEKIEEKEKMNEILRQARNNGDGTDERGDTENAESGK